MSEQLKNSFFFQVTFQQHVLPAWLGTLVPNPLQHLHWPRKKQKLKAEGGKGGSGGGAREGVKRVEKDADEHPLGCGQLLCPGQQVPSAMDLSTLCPR